LTVTNTAFTDMSTNKNVENSVQTVTCSAGFEPTDYHTPGDCSVLRVCEASGPAEAHWTGSASCQPKACSGDALDNTERNSFTSDGFTATVTCDNGFAHDGAGGYTSRCQPDAPCAVSWDVADDCVCVQCPQQTFAYSNKAYAGITGCTEDSATVNCDAGYCASGSDSFTATCSGTAPATVEWTDTDVCAPSSCGVLNIANSDTTSFVGSTGEWTEVRCNPGCHSNDCTSIVITCVAEAPCHSEYDHQDFECVCPDTTTDTQ